MHLFNKEKTQKAMIYINIFKQLISHLKFNGRYNIIQSLCQGLESI